MNDLDNAEIRIRFQVANCEIAHANDAVEDDIDAFAPHNCGPAPKWGWDNAVDIAEASGDVRTWRMLHSPTNKAWR